MKIDFQTVLYIIAAVIYFLYSFSKAKKKEVAKRTSYIPPQTKNVSTSPNEKRVSPPNPPTPFNFETILKEFEKNLHPEYDDNPYEEKPVQEPVKQVETTMEMKTEAQRRTEKWKKRSEDKGEKVRKGELRDPITTKIYSIEDQPRKPKSVATQLIDEGMQKQLKKSSINRFLHNRSKLRQAVVLSEILNRREE